MPKRGLITQAEVRAIALAQLDIRATSVVWDIGAGSGSVAIEAAHLAHQGIVYAVDPEPSDIALIEANAEAFGVPNVRTILGRAPEILATLPEPEAIFVGGTGRQVDLVLSTAFARLCQGGEHGGQRGHDRRTGDGLPHAEGARGRGSGLECFDRARN